MTTEPTEEKMLMPSETARMFGVAEQTLARWARAGKVPSIKTPGGHRRYREAEIRALLEAGAS
jgi:excisionase family DNA binding protein